MSSQIPVAKQTAWISLIPHIAVMGLIMLIWYQFNPEKMVMHGAINYILLSMGLRYLIPKSHREGMNYVRSLRYAPAIAKFEKSHQFFARHKWLDKYRYITLLSSSKMSYGEIALCNIAFCHGQLGSGNLSKEFYSKALEEYPESEMAKASLNLINAVDNQDLESETEDEKSNEA